MAWLLKRLGIKRVTWRLSYEVARKSGWLRYRYAASDWRKWEDGHADRLLGILEGGQGFFFGTDRERFTRVYREHFPAIGARLTQKADNIVGGKQSYFSRLCYDFHGVPDWRRNPFTKQVISTNRHWSALDFYSPQYGDLKFMLEPARFSAVYTLVRAYWYAGDEAYPAYFWSVIEDWMAQNPPQAGPLWICGQEAAFRLMAWCFGLYGFIHSRHTTPDRVKHLVMAIAAHADRIYGTVAYARSQKNNHALSEAAGLWTAGLLFPELPQADRWRRLGKRIFEHEIPQQIYDDGSYVQHSINYHRVMLHDLLWVVRLGEIHAEPFSQEIYRRLDVATQFLYQMTDPATGRAPNYGHNDGALVLPLSSCDYTDFRPALQAATYLGRREHLFPFGAWDEDLLWLFGPEALRDVPVPASPSSEVHTVTPQHPTRTSTSFPAGGYFTLHGDQSWALIRCARYRDRPGQADQLHVDLWWRAHNIACDAGTYLYSSEPPWANALAGTDVHNTVTVDGQDQMLREGRFLWLNWAQGTVRSQAQSDCGRLRYWEGEHDGYKRLEAAVTHRRAVVCLGYDYWLILDMLRSVGPHRYRLHWLVPDFPHTWDPVENHLTLATSSGPYHIYLATLSGQETAAIARADAHTPRGWRSLSYGHREPALSLECLVNVSVAVYSTVLGPGECDTVMHASQLCITTERSRIHLQLCLGTEGLLVSRIATFGEHHSHLVPGSCISC
jgi:asparagine synthase (glutamine-hydrolysing)